LQEVQKGTIGMSDQFEIGSIVYNVIAGQTYKIIGRSGNGNSLLQSHTDNGHFFKKNEDLSYMGGWDCSKENGWSLVTPAPKPKQTKNKTKKSFSKRPMYFVASKNGMTHKGLASKVNERKVDTFGNSITQALSKWEDKYGRKIDLKEAVVFKLVPHTIRLDKRNGRARIGSEIE
jgi:hypothetical protein